MAQTGQPGGRFPDSLDNNAVDRLAAPPEAESVPTADRVANASVSSQAYVPDNAVHLPAAVSTDENDAGRLTAGPLVYPRGAPNTNRSKTVSGGGV
jgi:hypothetical protein